MNTSQLMQLVDIGNSLIKMIVGSSDEDNKYTALLYAIRVEKIIDGGKTLASMSGGLEDGSLPKINAGMDQLRDDISKIIETMDKNKVTHMLISAGEDMKLRFRPKI